MYTPKKRYPSAGLGCRGEEYVSKLMTSQPERFCSCFHMQMHIYLTLINLI